MLLAGDLGGTNIRLMLVDDSGRCLVTERYRTADYPRFEAVLDDFFSVHDVTDVDACLGVAGPVSGQHARMTNLGWEIDAARLERECGFGRVTILNDLQATAYSVAALAANDLVTLRQGVPAPDGNVAVIAPGTGLGEAFLVHCNGVQLAIGTEGGHTDFAPADALQDELLCFCRAGNEHVSYETLCSGPGIELIYRFLDSRDNPGSSGSTVGQSDCGETAAAIVGAAMADSGGGGHCRTAVDLFVSILAAEAGNLALKVLATGGIWIAGGIAPRILPLLQAPGFIEAVAAKGRMSSLLQRMPVGVITNPDAPLLGAVRYGLDCRGGTPGVSGE